MHGSFVIEQPKVCRCTIPIRWIIWPVGNKELGVAIWSQPSSPTPDFTGTCVLGLYFALFSCLCLSCSFWLSMFVSVCCSDGWLLQLQQKISVIIPRITYRVGNLFLPNCVSSSELTLMKSLGFFSIVVMRRNHQQSPPLGLGLCLAQGKLVRVWDRQQSSAITCLHFLKVKHAKKIFAINMWNVPL